MTRLVASVFVESVAELDALALNAWSQGAGAIELRIDTFEGDPSDIAAYLCRHRGRMWIVTCRSDAEGGHFSGATTDRVARLIAATRETGAFVDFELADFKRSDNIAQKVILAATDSEGNERLILSSHYFDGGINDLDTIYRETRETRHGVMVKIAHKVDHIVESFPALDLMREQGGKSVAIAMGEAGLWTRVLAKKLGAFATYASVGGEAETAPGQLSVSELVNLYRWANIDSDTKVFGVVGDPVAHSLSPKLFNYWFEQAGINAVYLPLRVGAGEDGLARFLDECTKRSWLDLGGLSVTIPHKGAALTWACGGADSLSKSIGSVNTLAFLDGAVKGHNTDCYAAIGSLASALGGAATGLTGTSVDVLGAGGAARALLHGLNEHGCKVTLYGRDREKVAALAGEFSCASATWEDRLNRKGEVLINTTPIGMWPAVDESPMPADALAECGLVFDLIYRPMQTKLLREAAPVGCETLNGLDMFLRQAVTQFELWFQRTPDVEGGRALLQTHFDGEARA